LKKLLRKFIRINNGIIMSKDELFKIGQISDNTKKASVKAKLITKIGSKIVNLKKTGESIEVAEYLIADDTSTIRYQVWGDKDILETDKIIGKTLLIKNGWVSSFANKIQISKGKLGKIEVIDEIIKTVKVTEKEIDELKNPKTPTGQTFQVNELKKTSKNVDIKVKVVRKDEPRTVKGTLRVGTFLVGDPTGCILLTLWNDEIDQFVLHDVVQITNGYVSVFQDVMQLNKGKFGQINKIDEDFKVDEDNNVSADY